MRLRSRTFALLLTPALVLWAGVASAQASAEDAAAARTLFADAQKLMNADKFAEAKPKLEAAIRLDRKKGILLNLALCDEKLGLLSSAWNYWSEGGALAKAAFDPRAAEAARHVAALEPRLPKIRIDVPANMLAPDLVVKRDGTPLDAAVFGTPVPQDPGDHKIEATRPGFKPWVQIVTIDGKPGVRAVTVALERLAVETPKPVAAAPAPDEKKEAPVDKPAPYWTGRRIAGVTVAGVGLAGIAVGAALGAVTLGKANQFKSGPCTNSGGTELCNATGITLRSQARATGLGSDLGFAIGGAALAAGTIVFVTAPKAASPQSAVWVRVGPGVAEDRGQVLVGGAW